MLIKALRACIYSNILVSFSAAFLVYGFTTFLKAPDAIFYTFCVFGATLFTYNLQRFFRVKDLENKPSIRHQWIIKNKRVVFTLMLLGFVTAVYFYFIFLFETLSFLFLTFFGLISVFYAWRNKSKTIRELPFIKIHLIALSWMGVCFAWPLINENKLFFDAWWTLIFVYCYFIAITIPFDIRDLPYDLNKQKTIPQLIGIKASKGLSIFLLLVSHGALPLFIENALINPYLYLSLFGQVLFVLKANKKAPEMFYSGFIDGWIIFFGFFWMTV